MNGYNQYGYRGFSQTSTVLKTLIIINVAVYIVSIFFIATPEIDFWFSGLLAMHPFDVDSAFSGMPSFWPWQLVTYQFMHAGFFHILFNMYILYIFGITLQDAMGEKKFLAFYLLSGIGAGLLHLFLSQGSVVGASGAVMGVVVGMATLYPNQEVMIFPLFIPIKLKWIATAYVVIDLFQGLLGSGGNVANFAHLGGAATGFLLIKAGDNSMALRFMYTIFDLFKKKSTYNSGYNQSARVHKMYDQQKTSFNGSYQQTTRTTQTSSTPKQNVTVDGEQITQAKIDQILDKISASGYQNLTEREKKILVELSKKV